MKKLHPNSDICRVNYFGHFCLLATATLVIASFPIQMCYNLDLDLMYAGVVIASFPIQMCYNMKMRFKDDVDVIASFPIQMCYNEKYGFEYRNRVRLPFQFRCAIIL